MKYVIIEAADSQGNEGILIPFIFPKTLDHSKVSERFRHLLMFEDYIDTKVFSAGFIDISGKCYGASMTLNVGSDPSDTKLINDINLGYTS